MDINQQLCKTLAYFERVSNNTQILMESWTCLTNEWFLKLVVNSDIVFLDVQRYHFKTTRSQWIEDN